MEPIIAKASTSAALKNLSYFGALFVSLNPESYFILGVFMLIDTITGIARAGVVHGWRSVTSRALSIGAISKCLLILIPFLVVLTGHAVGFDLQFVARSTLNVLIVSELYSILSNIQSVRLGRDVQEFDAVNFVLEKLRTLLENTVKKQSK